MYDAVARQIGEAVERLTEATQSNDKASIEFILREIKAMANDTLETLSLTKADLPEEWQAASETLLPHTRAEP
jgi:hypothetical protein